MSHQGEGVTGTGMIEKFSITTCESPSHNPIWRKFSCSLDSKIALVRERFEECKLYHGSKCEPAAGEGPKRLIDVGSALLSPKLVAGSEISSVNRTYATLSHRWGGSIPTRTVLSNLRIYGKQIPFNSMPRTYREAIIITRALGIPYLWIDSLCIVQDSAEEWEIEASKMKDIYSCSTLNIAASDACGSTEGCFPDVKESDECETIQFNLFVPNNVSELAVRIQTGDSRRSAEHSFLSERGWVLQEQLLSRRMVFCMKSHLHWQCARTYKTESGVEFGHNSAICGIPCLREDLSISHDRVWRIWMEDFSSRKFTFWKDRLPSLAGITEHYQSITGDKPLLGGWRSSLLDDLLWLRVGRTPGYSPKNEAPFPSWSWLSCPAGIKFDYWQITHSTDQSGIEVTDHSKVIDVNVEWSRTPLISAVRSARLVIEGPVIDVSLEVAHGGEKFNPPYFTISGATIHHGPNRNSPIPWAAAVQFDAFDHVNISSYTCLLMRTRAHQEVGSYREIFFILKPESNSIVKSSHRRVGIGCFLGKSVEFGIAKRERICLI